MPARKDKISARAKSQNLSLRLDEKTRFVLEFVARVRRQSITTVVEEAIRIVGAKTEVGGVHENEGHTWLDYWDVSEGVRTMLMLADRDVPSNYEDDEKRDFIERHIEFFSDKNSLKRPTKMNVDVLWPHMDRFMERWRDLKHSDPNQVGREMADVLEHAGIEPPQWPRATKEPPAPVSSGGSFELDDDIPF